MQKERFDKLWRGHLEEYVTAIAWSPARSLLAVASAGGEVALWQERDWQFLQTTGSAVRSLGFSADETILAVADEQGVRLWEVATRAEFAAFKTPAVEKLAWHPREQRLAFSSARQVYLWESRLWSGTRTGTESPNLTFDFTHSSVLDLAWHPQQEAIAIGGSGSVKVWSLEHPTAEPYTLAVPGASLALRWSGDGTYLASGNLDRTLSVLEWGKPPPWLMQGFPGKVRQVAWSWGKNPLLATAALEGIALWQRQGDNWQSRVLEGHAGFVRAIAFQPRTQHLASAADDGRVCLWQQGKHLMQTLNGGETGCSCLAWSRDGTQVAVGGQSGEVSIWQRVVSKKGFG